MENKKIAIIALCIGIFVVAGIAFNSIFSSADKNNQEVVAQKESVKNSDTKLKIDLEEKEVVEPKEEEENKEEIQSNDESENNENDIDEENNENNQVDTNQSNDENIDSSNDSINQDNNQTNQENNQENEQPQPQKQTVTLAISCQTAINNGLNNQSGFSHLPSNGVILSTQTVEIEEGDTVFDVLEKVVRDNNIHMEYTGSGSTLYVEGIHNLYEFDGGQNSGWMYNVNGWYPNYGAGVYELKANDVIEWNYTCDLGADLGAKMN